jgi:acyl-CoA reductase-like NAD-dependent aldehyde dehydrogenase
MKLPFQEESTRCRVAQQSWVKLGIRERLRFVRELRFLMVEERHAITEAVLADVKRPPSEVLATDCIGTASALKFLETDAEKILAPVHPGRRPLWLFGSQDTVYREPHGIVGLIATWNYPIFLTIVPLVQALTAGNGVLWKPSEQTPKSAEVFGKLFEKAGFPKDLIQRLPVNREAGPQLAEADIDFLHFTGSDVVGKKLATRLGERLIPSVLELSGVDAMIVLPDANLELAARTAWYGVTLNRGQTCLATRRVLSHKSILPKLVELLRPLVNASQPMPLQTEGQVKQSQSLIADGLEHGAEILQASTQADLGSQSVMPAVIVAKDANLAICRQATFSPILAVIPFENEAEGISIHNQCHFGLGGSIFTSNIEAGNAMAQRLNCGIVVINDVIVPTAHPATPFGGRGLSGWGSTQGVDGLLAMTTPKVVSVRSGSFRPHVDGLLSNDPKMGAQMEGILLATHSRTLGGRVKGYVKLIRALMG